MRAVFVNHVPPQAPTIGGQRVARLAHAMASLGHQVVLLTSTDGTGETGTPLEGLAEALAGHDWTRPFHIAVHPRHAPYLPGMRTGGVPGGLRQAMIGVSYMLNSGVFTDWTDAARAYVPALRENFGPDVVWACFGNTDAWNIGRMTAAACKCPWVADFKDPWDIFIPTGFRRILAGRYRDAAAMTTFSDAHSRRAAPWFDQPKTVVYSGLATEMLDVSDAPPDAPPTLLMTGSVYDERRLETFLGVLAEWRRAHPGEPFRFAYAGGDASLVRHAATALDGLADVVIDDFLPLDELRRRQLAATANAYIRAPSSRSIFHHKVFELLSAARPVICFPEDVPEVTDIARKTGAVLLNCVSDGDLADALDSAFTREMSVTSGAFRPYTWESQAGVLAGVLERAAAEGRP